jgi:hypothetical protein
MSDNQNHPITPSSGGFFDQLGARIKLILRLMKDRRVNPLLKLLPIGSLLYMIVPDLAPGPIDDAAVIWIGAYLFVELCPPEIVAEHRRELESVIEGSFREVAGAPPEQSDTAEQD